MKLGVVVSADTALDERQVFQGSVDERVSSKGLRRADLLARALKTFTFQVVYASPLTRSKETADALLHFHPNAKVVEDQDLREIDYGLFEGMTEEQVIASHPAEWEKRNKDLMGYKPLNGESLQELHDRIVQSIEWIISKDQDAVIVSHPVAVKMIISHLRNEAFTDLDGFEFETTSLSMFEICRGHTKTILFNSLKHIEDD